MLTRAQCIVAAVIVIGGLAVTAFNLHSSADAQIEIRFGDDAKQPRPAALQPLTTRDVSAAQAHAIVAAAVAKAEQLGTKMDIAVVDAGGNLKAFLRMDGAWLGSIDIAIKKARTARYFDMNTGEIGKLSKEDGPLYNIEHSNGGLITFPGGVPLKTSDGTVIGAVGVSGSSVENDHAVASAGAAALQ